MTKTRFTATGTRHELINLTVGATYEITRIREDALTPRQRECYDLVLDGLSVRQIALQMGIGESAVSSLKQGIRRFYGVNSMAELLQLEIKRLRDAQRKDGGQ